MTRPPGTRGPNTALRIPEPLLARIDAFARYRDTQTPGSETTRSEAMRILLTWALDTLDAQPRAATPAPEVKP